MLDKRKFSQTIFTLLQNLHLAGFWRGIIYKGNFKNICVPGLNCYSCPAAIGACPIGAFQAVSTTIKYKFSLYATGFLLLFGAVAGRFICGWVCPFGLYQDLLHKIPLTKKSLYKPLLKGKYLVLALFVMVLPAFWQNEFGIGQPVFCKYVCPAGLLEAGIPALFIFPSLQSLMGALFLWKSSFFLAISGLSIVYYRFFCRTLCPLGALYSLSYRFSFLQIKFEQSLCVDCGKCQDVCKLEIDIKTNQQNLECIRCGDCIKACPTNALKFTSILKREERLPLCNQDK